VTDPACRCCGIRLEGPRAQLRRCILCDLCDRRHGIELQAHVIELVASGQLGLWHAITRMLVDDAHLAGLLAMVAVKDEQGVVSVWPRVLESPPRWRVVIGRALARNEIPAVSEVLDAVFARHLPGRNSQALRDAISRDLTDAMCMIDPSIVNVEVRCDQDAFDPEHFKIYITGLEPTLGQTVMTPEVEIPEGVARGPRGQA
jgi:hypothetical protein